jgi:hypothetical protein
MLENCIFYITPMYEFSRSQGQARTSADVCGTSALLPKADMPDPPSDVAEGPIAVIPVGADAAWVHFIVYRRHSHVPRRSSIAALRPTTAAQLAQRQRVQQD